MFSMQKENQVLTLIPQMKKFDNSFIKIMAK
jgi:hypothetical protein